MNALFPRTPRLVAVIIGEIIRLKVGNFVGLNRNLKIVLEIV